MHDKSGNNMEIAVACTAVSATLKDLKAETNAMQQVGDVSPLFYYWKLSTDANCLNS